MDKYYIEAMSLMEGALSKLNRIYRNAKYESFEDNKAYSALEKVIEDIEDFIRDVEHYSKPTQEGYLELKSNGRYSLGNIELTCGYPVEIFNTKYNEWNDGRIEHSDQYGGYYFLDYGGEHIVLNDDIKARVRV